MKNIIKLIDFKNVYFLSCIWVMYFFTWSKMLGCIMCFLLLLCDLWSLVYAVFGVASGADKDYLVLNEKCKILLSQRSSKKMGGSKFWWWLDAAEQVWCTATLTPLFCGRLNLWILITFLRNSASSFHWLSSSIFSYSRLVVHPASVTPPLISTIWCFRA